MSTLVRLSSRAPRMRGSWVLVKAGLLGAAALVILSGCAAFTPSTPEEAVTKRANERWAAWVKDDFAAAYQYNTPAYRAVVPLEKFTTMRGKDVRILKGEVVHVECESQIKCTVRVQLTSVPTMLLMRQGKNSELVTSGDETWLFENGQWWKFERL